MTTETDSTPADRPTPTPGPEQVAEAQAILARLAEPERRAVAESLAPPEPGADGTPLTVEQANEMARTDPARLWALYDAGLVKGLDPR